MAVALVSAPPDLLRMPTSTSFDDFPRHLFAEVSDDFSMDESDSAEQPSSHRVSFAEEVDVIPSLSPLDLIVDPSQLSDIWYDIFELDDFRTEVRELCRGMRTRCSHRADAKVCAFAQSYESRGLEQRSCLERQRRRYLTIKCVVRGQHGIDHDRLAQLSLKCTRWATELAAEEASRDFVHAYHEGEREALKRTPEESLDARRVRPRLSFPAED